MQKMNAEVLRQFAANKARTTAHVAAECRGKVSGAYFADQSRKWGTVANPATNGRTAKSEPHGRRLY